MEDWFNQNDSAVMLIEYNGDPEVPVVKAIEGYKQVAAGPAETNETELMNHNVLTVIHGLAEQVYFPYLDLDTEVDPEETEYTLVDIPIEKHRRLRDIALALCIRRDATAKFIRTRADNQLKGVLKFENIESLNTEEKVKLARAVSNGFAAYMGPNSVIDTVIESAAGFDRQRAFEIQVGEQPITMTHHVANETVLAEEITKIVKPVKNIEFQMRRLQLIIAVYCEKMAGKYGELGNQGEMVEPHNEEDELIVDE